MHVPQSGRLIQVPVQLPRAIPVAMQRKHILVWLLIQRLCMLIIRFSTVGRVRYGDAWI
jgi:hypothetical protein